MIAEERRHKLLEEVRRAGALSVSAASELLQVSRMTVHRDLDTLSAAGLLRKVHGGAVPISSKVVLQDLAVPFCERRPANAPAKQAIAGFMAPLLSKARTIALDASSTVFALASVLTPTPENPHPLVVTNSLPLFQEFQRRNVGYRLALTGGEPHARTGSLVGPVALRAMEGMRFDCVVVSAAGLMMEEGITYESTPEDDAIKQAFLARCSHLSILALDKTKINFLAPYPSSALSAFHLLVTEDGVRELRKREHSLT